MSAAIAGLTPLDPNQLVNLSVEDLRGMKMPELLGLAHQLGINVLKVQAERGKLLTEIMKHAHDA